MYSQNDIDKLTKEIEDLCRQRADIEAKIREQKEAENKKKQEEKDKEYKAIKNAIEAYNTKHNERLVLGEMSCNNANKFFEDFFPWYGD